MAADTYDVERAHRDGVNFVMLNVDNTKVRVGPGEPRGCATALFPAVDLPES